MRNIIPFDFKGSSVRVIQDENGDPWFISKDVAECLSYTNPSKAVDDHCKKAKSLKLLNNNDSLLSLEINNLRSDTKLIPESDVYRLVMRSQLDSAESFQDWVVDEVLPSIRKTGSYSIKPKTALELAKEQVFLLERLEQANQTIEKQTHSLHEKDNLILASNEASIKAGEILVREFVKAVDIIDIGEKKFYEWMRQQGIIMKSSCQPYQNYVARGFFTWKPTEEKCNGEYRYTLRITPRGKVWLAAKYMAYLDSELTVF